ncbi:uncharacterized protein LOC106166304 [Lingula anatina]|uniref:Uncharacterized protein LOC106166304 n=1 Tax=Lingula anatina TaxID=7574 RepID=A0A1S3IPY6_LINAN|nr:uncharacterized protein LOC106166304 [Lingula anatina]|eukprot:XP_013400285.1 uncharacterized protein LOC106166304 [Lingula anatina]
MADRTHVMEQITWSPKEDVFLSINDFGGHEVYKVAHNFFVTKEAITLIVFNLQAGSCTYKEAVGSWIANVYSRAPDSAILLVGTHADCLNIEEVDTITRELLSAVSSHLSDMASDFRTRLEKLEKRNKSKESGREAYKGKVARIKSLIQTPPRVAKHVFVISSKTTSGIAELEETLIRKAREKNYILPESWLQKVEHIETAKNIEQDPYLTLDSLTNMAELIPSQMQESDDVQRIEDVLSFLHAVLWFRDKPLLKTFIFHRQDVFIDILKVVLRHDIDSILKYETDPFNKEFTKAKFDYAKKDVLQRGIISRTMLECLWRRFNLGKQGYDAMLELLENFEVCYVVKEADEDRYHFPWLLKDAQPEDIYSNWPIVPSRDESHISTEVHFPVTCPTGLYEMAAVHLHGYLGQFKASRRDWKDGFYAKLDNQCHLCLERKVSDASPNGVIRLSIRGDDPIQVKKHSLTIFEDLLSLTEKECPGSPWDEFLVCPHCVHEDNNPPTLFDTPLYLLSVPLEAPVPYHPCPEEEPEFMASADFYYPVTAGEMTALHCVSLEKRAPLILKNIRRFGCLLKILSRLHRCGIFTEDEITAIQEPDQGNRLQSYLKGKNDFAFYQFCGALHDNGHAQTARLLRLPDLAMELPEDALSGILHRLVEQNVITHQNMKHVWREPMKMQKVSTLLRKLREGKRDYEAERGFKELRAAIYDEESELLSSPKSHEHDITVNYGANITLQVD